jgi:hypothetical protein
VISFTIHFPLPVTEDRLMGCEILTFSLRKFTDKIRKKFQSWNCIKIASNMRCQSTDRDNRLPIVQSSDLRRQVKHNVWANTLQCCPLWELHNAIFEAFTAVMFQVEMFLVVTPCSVVLGYQRFRGPRCLRLQGKVTGMGENSFPLTLVALAAWSLPLHFLLASSTCRPSPVRANIFTAFSHPGHPDWGFPCFSSVVRQMPEYKWKGARTAYTRPWRPSAEMIPPPQLSQRLSAKASLILGSTPRHPSN